MSALIDLTGKQIGDWKVLSYDRDGRWTCRCKCGAIKHVVAQTLRVGTSTGCGCRKPDTMRSIATTHGYSRVGRRTSEYTAWSGMKSRCYNERNKTFAYYGGRGITVCNRWRDSFVAFLTDMGSRPRGGTIERNDNSGHYEPSNCRWATRREQTKNRRNTKWLELNGERRTLREWSEYLNVSYNVLSARLWRGWTIDRALHAATTRRSR